MNGFSKSQYKRAAISAYSSLRAIILFQVSGWLRVPRDEPCPLLPSGSVLRTAPLPSATGGRSPAPVRDDQRKEIVFSEK